MALLFFDGFERHEELRREYLQHSIKPDYGESSIFSRSENGTSSRYIVTNSSNNDEYVIRALSRPLNFIVFGVAFRPGANTTANRSICVLQGTNGDPTCSVQLRNEKFFQGEVTPEGVIFNWNLELGRFTSYNNATVQIAQSTGVYVKPGLWYYLEGQIGLHNTTGTCILRLDGKEILNATGLDNLAGTSTGVSWWRIGSDGYISSDDMTFDDYYVCDLSGSTHTGFLGPMVVETLFPNGTGSLNEWTGSDGNSVDNHLLVNTPDGSNITTTNYVQTSGLGDVDLYQIDTLINANPSIEAVEICSFNRSYGINKCSGVPIVAVTGKVHSGEMYRVYNAERHYNFHIFTGNPDSGSGWIKSDVDSLEIGTKLGGFLEF